MEKKELVCIVCPMGCRLTVTKENDNYVVTGNQCPRGKDYGIKELTNPTRVLTTTVKIKNGLLNRIPVKTKEPIPKDKIFECMDVINRIEIEAPVKVGDIVVENVLETGVDVVASRSMSKIG